MTKMEKWENFSEAFDTFIGWGYVVLNAMIGSMFVYMVFVLPENKIWIAAMACFFFANAIMLKERMRLRKKAKWIAGILAEVGYENV